MPDATQIVTAAIESQQTGHLTTACRQYRQVLANNPRHVDALHLLGIATHRLGQPALGAKLICRAIRVSPKAATCFYNLGIVHSDLGRAEDACTAYRTSSALQPDFPDAQANLGAMLKSLGHLDQALRASARAISLRPDFAEAHANRGDCLTERSDPAAGACACASAACLKPELAEAYHNGGNALTGAGQLDAAEKAYGRAITLRPGFAEAYAGRGLAVSRLGRSGEALADYKTAHILHPGLATPYCNRGNLLRDQGNLEDARSAYQLAIRIAPGQAEAHSNLAVTLKGLGRYDEAASALDEAIRLDADFAEARFNRSLLLLLQGELRTGWQEYEWRWRGSLKELPSPGFAQPRWQGEDICGRTLLLHAEQGLGDCLQFCRFIPLARRSGGRVLLQVPPQLVRLLSNLEGIDGVVETGAPLPEIAVHCPLMSLPALFGITLPDLAQIPVPYLVAEKSIVEAWAARLAEDNALRVGLVWAGSPNHRNDHNRSMPFDALAPLFSQSGTRWYSLQLGERPRFDTAIEDLSPWLKDLAETTGALSQLDLLLTVDTAVAHLAGAMGRPAWVMLPADPDWRWLLDRQDSPWYPSLRLFRQSRRQDWTDVVARIGEALCALDM